MRYVVGYTPNRNGEDAINLAVSLAKARQAQVDIIVVLPVKRISYDMYVPDRAYHTHLEEQGREWLEQAMAHIPKGVNATGRVRCAESIARGLIEDAVDPDVGDEAALIVIGASHRGLKGRFTVGSVANGLLHSSPVPVALAPAGYALQSDITRINCATGTRRGAGALLDVSIEGALARKIPLRLMSLVALDATAVEKGHGQAYLDSARQHADMLVEKATEVLPSDCPVTGVVGHGKTT